MTIRPATIDDLAAMRRICLLTGDSGLDATGRWSSDELLADVFLEPYLRYPTGLGWVVDEEGGVVGYLVAAADTSDFVAWWRGSWVAEFTARHGATPERAEEKWLYDAGTQPELQLDRFDVRAFPAHLHIDLLPVAQGRRLGQALMRTLGEELQRRAVPGVHLGFGEDNVRAAAFYRRLGFDEPSPGVMTCPTSRLTGEALPL